MGSLGQSFETRVLRQFVSPENREYLLGLLRDRLGGYYHTVNADALGTDVLAFARRGGPAHGILGLDPYARRGLSGTNLWDEVARLNLAYFAHARDYAARVDPAAAGRKGPIMGPSPESGVGPALGDSVGRGMFITEQLYPPGFEGLNGPGPLYALREDQFASRSLAGAPLPPNRAVALRDYLEGPPASTDVPAAPGPQFAPLRRLDPQLFPPGGRGSGDEPSGPPSLWGSPPPRPPVAAAAAETRAEGFRGGAPGPGSFRPDRSGVSSGVPDAVVDVVRGFVAEERRKPTGRKPVARVVPGVADRAAAFQRAVHTGPEGFRGDSSLYQGRGPAAEQSPLPPTRLALAGSRAPATPGDSGLVPQGGAPRLMREDWFMPNNIPALRAHERDIEKELGIGFVPEMGFRLTKNLTEPALRPAEDMFVPARGPTSQNTW